MAQPLSTSTKKAGTFQTPAKLRPLWKPFELDAPSPAIDAAQDTLLKINPVTGAVLQQVGLSSGGAPLDLADCGLAWDCHTGRLLLARAYLTQGDAPMVRRVFERVIDESRRAEQHHVRGEDE